MIHDSNPQSSSRTTRPVPTDAGRRDLRFEWRGLALGLGWQGFWGRLKVGGAEVVRGENGGLHVDLPGGQRLVVYEGGADYRHGLLTRWALAGASYILFFLGLLGFIVALFSWMNHPQDTAQLPMAIGAGAAGLWLAAFWLWRRANSRVETWAHPEESMEIARARLDAKYPVGPRA